jgi:hypothetical protein
MDDVKIVPKKGPVFTVRNSSGWKLNGIAFPEGIDTFMQLEGKTAGIQIAGTDPSAAKTPFVYGSGVSKDAVSVQGK